LTFRATEQGYEGLCPCRELTYITTAGGPVGEMDLGYDYIRGVGRMLGIRTFRDYRAEGLDIRGADVDGIMAETLEKINHG
ncbi:MAG: ACP phosphodiesterase, partial [Clostridiales bacterium]|nr:ACP phosphodiesterase [Clostridiales bacterium]